MSFSAFKLSGLVIAGMLAASAAHAEDPMVGGKPMYANKTIVENAGAAPNLTTLVAAVKQAGLVDTLSGAGPFTVFAPTNDAFDALPSGTVPTLMEPANKSKLGDVLKYHVVSGDYDSRKLMDMVGEGKGKATLKTVEGEPLTVMQSGKTLTVTDAKGNVADVTTADVKQSNGEVHVINKVLMP